MRPRNTVILIGTLVGATLGATAAWAYTKLQSKKQFVKAGGGTAVQFQATATDYVKIGLALLAVMRQITDLFQGD